MYLISKTSIVKCVTCQYWTGKRDAVFDKKGIPKIDIVDLIGECENENYKRFCGTKRSQKGSCKHFSKWTELL